MISSAMANTPQSFLSALITTHPCLDRQVVQFVQSFVNRVLGDLSTFGFYSATTSEPNADAISAGLTAGKDGAFNSDSSVRHP